ncbi:MAG: lysine--tRNA ligase [Thermoplasmata archaeon]
MHWFDELAHSIDAFLSSKGKVVCNAGLSVSGLQHVGRLRGEIILNHFIASHLRSRGLEVQQHLVLYTQDRWKGSPGQVEQFPGDEGREYVGWRLLDVPDPQGCHENWVDHFWLDFAESMEFFAPGVQVASTSEIYERPDMRALVLELISRAEEVRIVLNRYRPRNPHPQGWIPFEPLCNACKKIGEARTLEVRDEEALYECTCGDRGASPLHLGKLNWRLEWPALWKVLQVDVEPFGKDHAAPGGSRESCQIMAETVLDITPPFGIPYEWVGYAEGGRDMGDMASSDFRGFGPKEWLAVADPEVLRFVFANAHIKRRIVLDLSKVDSYHQTYDQAETSYYESREDDLSRVYELSQLGSPREEMPYQISYRHAALLSQVAPEEELLAWSVRRLRETELLDRSLKAEERERLERRLKQSLVWARTYGPADIRVSLLQRLPEKVLSRLTEEDRKALSSLASQLSDVPWKENTIKEAMVKLTSGGELPVSTKRFFGSLYMVFLGKPSGPRAAPLLAVLDRDFVIGRLREASGS